jgi:hypothetical protein
VFTSIFESASDLSGITFSQAAICIIAAFIIGIIIAAVYMFTGRYSQNFIITIVLLPVVIQAVIIMVNGSLGTGIAVLGAFSLIRFRSVPGTSREITVIFMSMACGLSVGMGEIGYGFLICLICAAVMLLLHFTKFGQKHQGDNHLRITIPEDLDYTGAFTDIFDRYLLSCKLESVKTTNLGTMFELTYAVRMKDPGQEKEMIDEIRCRNGNLTVVSNRLEMEAETL